MDTKQPTPEQLARIELHRRADDAWDAAWDAEREKDRAAGRRYDRRIYAEVAHEARAKVLAEVSP